MGVDPWDIGIQMKRKSQLRHLWWFQIEKNPLIYMAYTLSTWSYLASNGLKAAGTDLCVGCRARSLPACSITNTLLWDVKYLA